MSDDEKPDDHRPARGYSWAPFTAGNQAAVTHGATSERHLRPIVAELLEGLAEAAPWAMAAPFTPTREAWAWAEARAVRYRRWFDEHGQGEGAEDAPASLAEWDRVEARAAKLRAELGLSPSSLTKLLRALSAIDAPAAATGLEALRAAGAQIRQAAEQAQLPTASESEDQGEDEGDDAGDDERTGVRSDDVRADRSDEEQQTEDGEAGSATSQHPADAPPELLPEHPDPEGEDDPADDERDLEGATAGGGCVDRQHGVAASHTDEGQGGER